MKQQVLLLDEQGEVEVALRSSSAAMEIRRANDLRELIDLEATGAFHVAIIATRAESHLENLGTPVVIVLDRASPVEAVEVAIRAAAWLVAPVSAAELLNAVKEAIATGPRSATDSFTRTLRKEELARLTYRQALDLARHRAAREYLVALMERCAGNVVRAAERAGVERESLHRLLRRHGSPSRSDKRST